MYRNIYDLPRRSIIRPHILSVNNLPASPVQVRLQIYAWYVLRVYASSITQKSHLLAVPDLSDGKELEVLVVDLLKTFMKEQTSMMEKHSRILEEQAKTLKSISYSAGAMKKTFLRGGVTFFSYPRRPKI